MYVVVRTRMVWCIAIIFPLRMFCNLGKCLQFLDIYGAMNTTTYFFTFLMSLGYLLWVFE